MEISGVKQLFSRRLIRLGVTLILLGLITGLAVQEQIGRASGRDRV